MICYSSAPKLGYPPPTTAVSVSIHNCVKCIFFGLFPSVFPFLLLRSIFFVPFRCCCRIFAAIVRTGSSFGLFLFLQIFPLVGGYLVHAFLFLVSSTFGVNCTRSQCLLISDSYHVQYQVCYLAPGMNFASQCVTAELVYTSFRTNMSLILPQVGMMDVACVCTIRRESRRE